MATPRLSPQRRPYGSALGIILFLLPGLGLYTLLMLYPTIQSFVYSVIRWEGLRPTNEFAGLSNYAKIVTDPVVRLAIGNNLRALFLYLFVQLPLAFVLAFALGRKARGVALFRFLYYIPCVTSGAVLALLWRFIYTYDYALNALLRKLGLGLLVRPWLSADGVVQWTTNIPATWQWVGFYMVIFLAAINGIPEERFEAAQLDGANAWQELIHITLPATWPVIVAASIAELNDALQVYIYQFILTEGGPLHRSQTLVTYALHYIWIRKQWGYGSALAVFQFVLAALLAGIVWRYARRSREE